MAQSETHSISGAIVKALAEIESVDPSDLNYLLYDYIDTDAIEALTRKANSEWSLEFTVADHTVTVTNERTIVIDGVEYR